MGKKRQKHELGIRLKPTDLTTNPQSTDGEISVDSNDNKLKVRLNAGDKSVVTEDQTQTLTNKSINADNNPISNLETDNLKAGVLVTNIASATSDTEIPSALAVKTALASQNEASEITYDNTASGLAATNVKTAIDEVDAKVDEIDVNVNDLITLSGVAENATNLGTFTGVTIADNSNVKQAAQALETAHESHTGATVAHGATGAVVGTTNTQTLTNKTLTGASIQTPTRSDVKQDTLANLTTYALTATNGQLCFATDEKAMFQVIDTELAPVGGAGGTTIDITQTAHGFAVGNGIRHNGSSWVKGMSDLATTTSTFVVTEIKSVNRFVAYQFGRVEITAHGFTVGEFYFQSNSTAGLATSTEPTSGFSNPLFYVESANFIQVMVFRPSQIGVTINLDDLSDVNTSGALNDYVIKYNGSTWYAGVGSTVNALDDLTDVNTAGQTNGQFLKYNGSQWVPASIAGTAASITYSNATSGLAATNVQTAIDEVEGRLDTAETSLSSHTSSTTAHGATGAVVGTTNTQTLTNKTLTSPAINTATITSSSIVTPSRSDMKQDTYANLVTYASTAAEGQLCFATDEDRSYVVRNSLLREFEATNPIKNYIDNGDFRASTTGWVLYNDGGSLPTDGVSGAASSFAFNRNTTTPLRPPADGRLEISAATLAAGQGVAYAFTMDKADTAPNWMELNLDFDFSATGNIFGFFLYDVTNSTLVRASFGETSSSIKGRHKALFIANGGTSYRLIIHQILVGPSGAGPHYAFVDNVTFGPLTSAFNSTVGFGTDFESITAPTGTWTNTTYSARVKREFGEVVMELKLVLTGAPAGGTLLINVPTGYTPDFTQMMTPTTNAYPVGEGTLNRGATGYKLHCVFNSTTQFLPVYEISSANTAVLNSTSPITFQAGDEIIYRLKYPVVGWQTGITMSTVQKNMIPYECLIRKTGSQSIPNLTETKVTLDTVVKDVGSLFLAGSNRIVVAESGSYEVIGSLNYDTNATGNRLCIVKVNGVEAFLQSLPTTTGGYGMSLQANKNLDLNAGDYVELFTVQNSGGSLNLGNGHINIFLSVKKNNNPADLIYPTDKIVARYKTAAAQSIPNSTAAILNAETKVYDTHNAVTVGASWKFTAPRNDYYNISSMIVFGGATFSTSGAIYLELFKNGVQVQKLGYFNHATTVTPQYPGTNGTDVIYLVKGDYVDIRIEHNEASARSLLNDSNYVYISITSGV